MTDKTRAHEASVGALQEKRALTIIKWLAMIFLIVDHVSLFLLGNDPVGRALGRIAFPLFAYLIATGMRYSSDLEAYFWRIVLLAVFSEVPFDFALTGHVVYLGAQNVLWTFALAILVAIAARHANNNRSVWLGGGLLAAVIAGLINTDYGFGGVLCVLVFYLVMYGFKGDELSLGRARTAQVFGVVVLIAVVVYEAWRAQYVNMFFEVPALLALPALFLSKGCRAAFDSGEKKISRYWYLVYPLQFIIIALIGVLLGNYPSIGFWY